MAPELFKVSVPGSLMLMGEHAVLHGKQALVCAVDRRLHMQLIPDKSTHVTISDTRLGTLTQKLDCLYVAAPFKFVLQAILLFKDQIRSGFALEINAEFSSVIGFGSSAAVTVATVAVIAKWLDIPLSDDEIFIRAKQVMLAIQGVGSGADIAASVYGGILRFDTRLRGKADKQMHSICPLPSITAIYCGYKTPTPEVIDIVQKLQAKNPEKFANLYDAIHECVTDAEIAIQNANWPELGSLFLHHHQLQAELGTSNADLDALVNLLSAQSAIYGAKISGAGLGDCVIGLGAVPQQIIAANDGMLQFQINVEQQGLSYASN